MSSSPKKIDKKRLSLFVPSIIYDRIDCESKIYGVTKTVIVQSMILSYYRDVDSKYRPSRKACHVSSDKAATSGAADTP
ncbi:hypothetical protein AALB16_11650 [Lachnospiraceae bacterium 62-35]